MLQRAHGMSGDATVGFHADLAALRALATTVPGPLPLAVNGIKVAASVRPRKFVIEGGDDTAVVMPRTAFQIVYPDGTVMIDSALDRETHQSFGGNEPYDEDQFETLTQALNDARMIVFTHYHADHVAGVLRARNAAALARKTFASARTIALLQDEPHRPHLRIDKNFARLFISFEYTTYYPVAPGLVLIKAPGHSPDMQMAFIRLQSGQEILHAVDAAWNMENIVQIRPKAAPWVIEDVASVMSQLQWLKHVCATEPKVAVLVTHDGEQFDALVRQGVIGGQLTT